MSLQSRLSDLITSIGADIKSLRNSATYNASTTNQVLTNGETYLAGSSVDIPQGKIKVGTRYRCTFNVVKTAAGTAAPTIAVKVGTAGTTADTTRATLTQTVQTALVDEGTFEIDLVFRVAGSVAVAQALSTLVHRLPNTGLSTSYGSVIIATSAAFDITGASLKIGLAVNVGLQSNWTISLVSAELVNLAV